MKTYLTLALIAISFTVYSQNYQLNGNLGLGTVPENKLDVSGDSKMDGKLTVTEDTKLEGNTELAGELKLTSLADPNNPDGYLLMVNADGSFSKVLPDQLEGFTYATKVCHPNVLPKWVNGPGLMYIGCPDNPIRLGIGTTNPDYKIDVRGSAQFGSVVFDNNYSFGDLTPSLNPYRFRVNTDDDFGVGINVDGTNLKSGLGVYNNGESVFKVFSNGTISTQLIGNPWAALEIKNSDGVDIFRVSPTGGLTCTHVKVTMTPFPDYVFDLDYDLMPLADLKLYIAQKHRLPNMPSSTEVSEKGGDIGEITRLLVEKTEEQALYLLEHEEEVEALESELKVLQAELDALRKLIMELSTKN